MERGKRRVILGIDFGTTNICVSYYDYKQKESCVILNEHSEQTTPSVVSFQQTEVSFQQTEVSFQPIEILFGKVAKTCKNYISNIKRLIGINYSHYMSDEYLQNFFNVLNLEITEDPDTHFCLINGHKIRDLVIHFIKYIETITKDFLPNTDFYTTVITVPAYYSHIQRELLKKYFESCNFVVLRIINEPTAAVLAYATKGRDDTNANASDGILVIDCGGGTTDLSVISIEEDEDTLFEVKSTYGDNYLGGEDITILMTDYIKNKINIQFTNRDILKIYKECERVKCVLSYRSSDTCYLENVGGTDYSILMTRTEFLNISKPFFDRLTECITKINFTEDCSINKIVFVGGTTRIPYFTTLCKKFFGHNVNICNTIDPDITVSTGAAIHGFNLNSYSNDHDAESTGEILLLDIVPMSIGVETENGLMTIIISKNTSIPISKTQIFLNNEDNCSEINVNIYQGNKRRVKDNTFLGQLTLTGLDTSKKRGEMKISVTFDINADGMLNVKAHCDNSVVKSSIKY